MECAPFFFTTFKSFFCIFLAKCHGSNWCKICFFFGEVAISFRIWLCLSVETKRTSIPRLSIMLSKQRTKPSFSIPKKKIVDKCYKQSKRSVLVITKRTVIIVSLHSKCQANTILKIFYLANSSLLSH